MDGPALDPFDITRRARAAYGPDGRPALPKTAHWPIFPFAVDGLLGRPLEDPVVPEPPRRDERADECHSCRAPDDEYLWTDDRWRVSMPAEPPAVPVLTLHPRQHLDLADLTDEQGAGLGVLLVRAERALRSVGGVGRVQVYKWGDGGAHLHVVLIARPEGMMQLRGMYLSTWMHMLPPLPAEQWQAIRAHVATRLG